MNKKSIALFVCLSSLTTLTSLANPMASDSTKTPAKKEMKTLINSNLKFTSWGVSVSPIMQFGHMGRQSGITALFHLNNSWGVGMSMMGSLRKEDPNFGVIPQKQVFGGLHVEYTPKANALVHVSFPLTIGVIGEERLPMLYELDPTPNQNINYLPGDMHNRDNRNNFDKSFGIQPGVNLEVNLFKYAKLFGGVNYRFAMGQNANDHIQGLGGQFGFKFGLFNKAIKK